MADTKRFRGKKIAVLGFGVESRETVEFLLKAGARLTLFDEKDEQEFDTSKLTHLRKEGVSFVFGPFDSFKDFDIIVRSPGIRPGIHALHEAGDLGIEITSATNIFFEFAHGTTIGITGTKGKGTTAALLFQILKAVERDVYLGGNIGIPALSFVEKLDGDSISILELSSFQLIDAQHSPAIAVLLMITEDHLDYHLNADEYARAKIGIVRHQGKDDTVIANLDYPSSLRIAEQSVAKKIYVSARKSIPEGCYVSGTDIVWKLGAREEKIAQTTDVLLPGKHNLENVCAAVAVAKVAGVENKYIRETLKAFRGLTHRLQLVAEVKGVNYYNDSISTTPESAIAAIRAFNAPEILILGGSSKNSDFTELGKTISSAHNIRAIIGIGAEWPRIKQKVSPTGRSAFGGKSHKFQPKADPPLAGKIKIVENLRTMNEIVKKAHTLAEPGDVVILSPACASFDMFKDYKDRGDQFVKEIAKL